MAANSLETGHEFRVGTPCQLEPLDLFLRKQRRDGVLL